MTPTEWLRIETILEPAAQLKNAARIQFLDQQCADDPELRKQVESYLAAIDTGSTFLEKASWSPMSAIASARAEDLQCGDLIGSYRIDRPIGHGGMGTVYLASRADEAFNRPVALKVIHTPSAARRFQRECFILARLEHPNIARLYDAGKSDSGIAYMVMEYVDGHPIHQYCQDQNMSLHLRLRLFQKVCQTVQFAHQNLVLHHDLKPENILVDQEGEPRLLDFGIASILDPRDQPSNFRTTDFRRRPLTPLYASPEQIDGAPLTTASDIYALGLLLFELLASEPPFAALADQPVSLARAIVEQIPPPPSQTQPSASIPPDLDAIVLKTLRKEPPERYVSAEHLAQDVGRFLEGLPVLAQSGTWLYNTTKLVTKYWQYSAMVLFLFALTASFAVAMKAEASRTEQQRQRALKVTNFMVKIFGTRSPEIALGRDLTVEQAMFQAVQDLPQALENQPEIRTELELAFGKIYRDLGLHAAAQPLLDRAVQERRKLFGNRSTQLAQSLFERGILHTSSAQYPEAEVDLLQALEIQRKTLGSSHPATIATLQELGSLSGNLADWNRATHFLSEALASQRRLDPQSPETARVSRELGIVLAKQGNFSFAEELFKQALVIQEDTLSPLHPEIQRTVESLAISYGTKGDMATAEIYFKRSLAAQEELLPENHPELLTSRHNLAVLYTYLSRPDDAERLFRQTMGARESILPTGSLRLFESYHALGDLLISTQQLAEAEVILEKAFAQGEFLRAQPSGIREAIRREVKVLFLLGNLFRKAGQNSRAEETWRSLCTTMEELDGPDRPVELDAITAMALLHLGELDQARPLVDRVLASKAHYPKFLDIARQHDLVN